MNTCAIEGCDAALGNNNKSGICAPCGNAGRTPRKIVYTQPVKFRFGVTLPAEPFEVPRYRPEPLSAARVPVTGNTDAIASSVGLDQI